jgi:hypothetical protein
LLCVCVCICVCLPSLRRNKRSPRQSNQASAILTSWGFAAHNIRPARCEGFVRFCTVWMHLWQCATPKTHFLIEFILVPKFRELFFCAFLYFIMLNTSKFQVICQNGAQILFTLYLIIYCIHNKIYTTLPVKNQCFIII